MIPQRGVAREACRSDRRRQWSRDPQKPPIFGKSAHGGGGIRGGRLLQSGSKVATSCKLAQPVGTPPDLAAGCRLTVVVGSPDTHSGTIARSFRRYRKTAISSIIG